MEKLTANISSECDHCGKDIDAGSQYCSCNLNFYWICLECGEDKALIDKYDSPLTI